MELLTRYRLTFAKVDSEKGEEGGRKEREGGREGGEGRGGKRSGWAPSDPVCPVLQCMRMWWEGRFLWSSLPSPR